MRFRFDLRLRTPALMALLILAWPFGCEGQVYVDPDAARDKSPAFRLQGEYLGKVQDRDAGLQVIAENADRLRLVVFYGGLPGEDGARRDPEEAVGKVSAERAELFYPEAGRDGDNFVLKNGKAKVHGVGPSTWTLKKTHRKSPTLGEKPPEDAIVLFDGTEESMRHWKKGRITDGGLLKEGARTKDKFRDFSLHLEFRLPFKPSASGQSRGNSGVYVHHRYEVQLLDTFGRKPMIDGCGALYKFRKPDVNMCYPPLSWQTYDIEFTAARFNEDGEKTKNARITVRHNGATIHEDVELPGGTGAGAGRPEIPAGPIVLQDHGNPVRFRNVWLVEE